MGFSGILKYSFLMNVGRRWIFLVGVVSLLLFPLNVVPASASCSLTSNTNSWGQTTTSGTCNGKRVSTTSSTNSWGQTTTTGRIGNDRVSTTSNTNSWGQTTTTGRIGNCRVSTTSSTNSWGQTTTSGKNC